MGYNHWKEIESILGQSVYEHELVKGDEKTALRIRHAGSIHMIIEILNERHADKYGRRKFLPNNSKKRKLRDRRYIETLENILKKEQ